MKKIWPSLWACLTTIILHHNSHLCKQSHVVDDNTYSHHVSYGICLSFRSDSLILLILNGKRKQDELDTLVLITNVIQSFRPYKYYLTIKNFKIRNKQDK